MNAFENIERQLLNSVAARRTAPSKTKEQRFYRPKHALGSVRARVVMIALSILTASGAGLAIASTLSGNGITPVQYAHGSRSPIATSPSGVQTAAFEILRRPLAASDALPAQTLAILKEDPATTGLTGANFAQARRASGLSIGSAWVVPGHGWICVYAFSSTDGSESVGGLGPAMCEPDFYAASGRSVSYGERPDRPGVEFITGLVPDGVNRVTLYYSRHSETIPVGENIYTALVPRGVHSVGFVGPSGAVRARVG